MPVNIRVRNFQSIEDAEIEVAGLTVVTGQNNSGKTATVRAVRGVFENPGGDAFVRHGTDALSVHLDFGDADVTWSKGPKVKPTYVIGGKTIHPGRAVPDEVASLGVVPVRAGAGEVWPQIAPQFTGQIFLLDLPGSAIAEVVSDVDRVSKLTEALRYADSDKRSANADLKLRRKDRDDAETEVALFDGLDAAGDVVETATQSLRDASAAEAVLADAQDVADALKAATARVTALLGITSVVVPDTAAIKAIDTDLTTVRRLAGDVRRHRATIAGLPQGVAAPDVADVRQAQGDLTTLRDIARRLQAAQTTVASLPSGVIIPAVAEVQLLAPEVATVRGMSVRVASARASVARYEKVNTMAPDTAPVTKVANAIAALAGMRDRVGSARKAVSDLERTLAETIRRRDKQQGELEVVLVEVGACPTCGSASGADGVHQHGVTS